MQKKCQGRVARVEIFFAHEKNTTRTLDTARCSKLNRQGGIVLSLLELASVVYLYQVGVQNTMPPLPKRRAKAGCGVEPRSPGSARSAPRGKITTSGTKSRSKANAADGERRSVVGGRDPARQRAEPSAAGVSPRERERTTSRSRAGAKQKQRKRAERCACAFRITEVLRLTAAPPLAERRYFVKFGDRYTKKALCTVEPCRERAVSQRRSEASRVCEGAKLCAVKGRNRCACKGVL